MAYDLFDFEIDHAQNEQFCPVCSVLPLDILTTTSPPTYLHRFIKLDQFDPEALDAWKTNCGLCRLFIDLRLLSSRKHLAHPVLDESGRRYSYACGSQSLLWLIEKPDAHIIVRTDFDSIVAKPGIPFLRHEDPWSDHCVAHVKHWIEKCNAEHRNCSVSDRRLPTRVLDVGTSAGSEVIRLFESQGQKGTYAALSHCWGTSKAFLTTRATLEARKKGFSLGMMPATFRDAVRVVRALGVRFLWIDSLCIIQGDTRDWEIEGSRMGDVYSNAYLTIAASNAGDNAEGFLKGRQRKSHLSLDLTASPGDTTRIYLQLPDYSRGYRDDPWHDRAWVLQKHYLAPRLLLFSKQEFHWECSSCDWHEMGPRDWLIKSVDQLLPKLLENRQVSYEAWYLMAANFSQRRITYKTDKLPALSGLASRVSTLNDRYLAGIWWRDVGSGLLWSRVCQGRSLYASSRHRPSRGDIVAPSWSWVSFDGPIQFHTLYSSTSRESIDMTSYIDFHVEAPANNTYGEVRVGWIRIAAPLLLLITLDNQDPLGLGCDPWTRPWSSYAYEFAHPDIDVFVETCLDYPEDSAGEVLALPICCSNDMARMELEDWRALGGLLIRSVEAPEPTYEKVGCFYIVLPPEEYLDVLHVLGKLPRHTFFLR